MQNKHDSLQRRALFGSFIVGIVVLIVKYFAWKWTSSAAIFSDTAESVVHVAVGAFALFSLHVAAQPPDENHHFGYDKITFISSGIEGVLILLAAVFIIVEAGQRLVNGSLPEHLGFGAQLMGLTIALNGILGLVLLRIGKQTQSLLINASGKFILADVWTSLGVLVGLGCFKLFGHPLIDPLVGIAFAVFLIKPGLRLVREATWGLLDATNSELELKVTAYLTDFCTAKKLKFHGLRLRESGTSVHVDFHLQFPDETTLPYAHTLTTKCERRIEKLVGAQGFVMAHIEPFTIPDEERDLFD